MPERLMSPSLAQARWFTLSSEKQKLQYRPKNITELPANDSVLTLCQRNITSLIWFTLATNQTGFIQVNSVKEAWNKITPDLVGPEFSK